MERRTFLKSGAGLVGVGAFAGCLEALGFQTQSAWRDPPLVDNRPNAVYYPALTEGMGMYGMMNPGDCAIAVTYSYPHRFWTLAGKEKNKVVVKDDDSLHLMANIWNPETETTLPTNVSVEIRQNGERVDKRDPWPMLSPTMGFHYGDNISLNGEGDYTARVSVKPMQAQRMGVLKGTLTETQTVDIPFEFDTNNVYDLAINRFGDKVGTKGAPELMTMKKMPQGVAPPKADLPGTVLGTASSGEGRAEFVVTALNDTSQTNREGQTHLAVSARTPYNQVILPMMSLSATLTRNGETVFDGRLQSAVDPAIKYHYGTAVESVETGDTLTIGTRTPPQIARHDGYETSFIDMPEVQLTV